MSLTAVALRTHRGALPPRFVMEAASALADAFASDPWARHVTGRPPRPSDEVLMRVPVVAAARRGGLLVAIADANDGAHPTGHVVGVSTWVPATQRGGGATDMVRARALHLPIIVGPTAMGRLVREESDTDRWLEGLLRPDDAYLWVLGVRRDTHGAGLGRKLVEATVADAAKAGHRRIVLITYNPENVPRYERMGFTVLDRSSRPTGLRGHVLARRC